MRKVGIGVIGCGVISKAYMTAMKQFRQYRAARGRRHALRRRRSAGQGIRRSRHAGRPDAETRRHRDRRQPDGAAGPHRRQPRGAQRRQARPFREAARRQHGRGAQGDGPRRAAKPAGRLRARHLPRRRPPDRAQADRRRRHRHSRSAAPPSSCAPATNAGIPRPASTTCAAADRCSTWAPTTSPTWSTCSARSPRVMGSAPSRGSSG